MLRAFVLHPRCIDDLGIAAKLSQWSRFWALIDDGSEINDACLCRGDVFDVLLDFLRTEMNISLPSIPASVYWDSETLRSLAHTGIIPVLFILNGKRLLAQFNERCIAKENIEAISALYVLDCNAKESQSALPAYEFIKECANRVALDKEQCMLLVAISE